MKKMSEITEFEDRLGKVEMNFARIIEMIEKIAEEGVPEKNPRPS